MKADLSVPFGAIVRRLSHAGVIVIEMDAVPFFQVVSYRHRGSELYVALPIRLIRGVARNDKPFLTDFDIVQRV